MKKLLIEEQIDKFILKFCEKENIEYDSYDINWVGDSAGGVLNVGDNFFNLEDIILDMKTEQPENNIFEWQNTMTDLMVNNPESKYQNYKTWCMNGNKLLK